MGPTSRAEFKEMILQNLGKGILRIEMTDDQAENWINYALTRFADYHFDGSQEMYFKYQLTDTDISNGYITMPDNVFGVVEIFDLSSVLMGVGMWNVQYQYMLGAMPFWGLMDLTNYWMTMQHLELIQQVLVGKQPIRYNRYVNKLYIDMDWSMAVPGTYLVVKTFQEVDPDTYTKVWRDQWLQNYTTQLFKRQWGNNLKKITVRLLDGREYTGQQIYDEADAEIKRLDAELINTYSLPVSFMIG